MATYLVLSNFTDQGIRNIKETTNRADAVRRMAKEFNVTVKEIFWTVGQYDVVSIFEAPDDSSVTALCLAIGQAGNIRTEMLRAFNAEEMRGVIGRMSKAREAMPA